VITNKNKGIGDVLEMFATQQAMIVNKKRRLSRQRDHGHNRRTAANPVAFGFRCGIIGPIEGPFQLGGPVSL
jgi:hypothetical protein